MALELTGKLIKVLAPQTGTGKNGNWVKQEFIIETMEQYPKKVCLSAWGDKAEEIKRYGMGDTLRVSVNLESREYNERWYTEARAWRIEDESAASSSRPQSSGNQAAASSGGDNFGFEPYTPSTKTSESAPAVDDDLPF